MASAASTTWSTPPAPRSAGPIRSPTWCASRSGPPLVAPRALVTVIGGRLREAWHEEHVPLDVRDRRVALDDVRQARPPNSVEILAVQDALVPEPVARADATELVGERGEQRRAEVEAVEVILGEQ